MAIPDYFKSQKAPADVLPWSFDWSRWLARNAIENPSLVGDTISDATITATSGISVGSTGIDDTGTIVSATVSGGTDGTDYTLTCQITTLAGLIANAVETIQVRSDAR